MARRGENIYKRKDGRYEGRYIKAYDEHDKPILGYVYGKTYKEAKELLTKRKAEAQAKRKIISSEMTVEKWFEVWLNTQKRLKKSTIRTYSSSINKHINSNIGKLKLRNLSKDTIQSFVDELSLTLAAKSVHSVFSVLKLGLDYAYEKNLITDMYSKTKLPKIKIKEVDVFTRREQEKIERYIEKSDNKNDYGILVCFYTGIRVGEVCAIDLDKDVDIKRGILTINNTLYRVKDSTGKKKTRLELSPPKSESSKRSIPLPAFLVKLFSERKSEGGFFINNKGKWIDPTVYTRRYKKILEELDIPYRKFHATRHTFATRALELNMDNKTLSEILGHSSPVVTMRIYAHSLPEHKRKQMNRIAKLYNPSK